MNRFAKIVAVGVTLVLVGCHSGSSPSPTTSSPSSSPTGSPSVSATASSSPTVQRCKLGQLSVAARPTQGAAGSTAGIFVFTNTSATPCSLEGYPGMQMLDAGGTAISTHVIRGTSVVVPLIPVTLVILAPAAKGSFLFGYSNNPTGSETCPTSTKLEITPPNDFGHFTITDAISPCGGRITVSPVRRGTSTA